MNAWQVCGECGDDWCNIHCQHVKDCPCPMHHEWPQDPLTSKIGNETTPPRPAAQGRGAHDNETQGAKDDRSSLMRD